MADTKYVRETVWLHNLLLVEISKHFIREYDINKNYCDQF